MRRILTLCALLLAVGAAGVSAQQAQQPTGKQENAKTSTTAHHRARRHRTTAKTSVKGKESAAVQQANEAKEDVNAAATHINKAEQDVKSAEKTGSSKATTTAHHRRHTTKRTTGEKSTKKESGSTYTSH